MTLHYRAEGRQSYAVLLFAPSTKPFDLFDQARKGKVKLYVRRVFIADDADLLPAYLRFIRGVIDSEDLPLNISREMLQNNPQLAQIRKAVTSRVISELESLGDKEPEAFAKIWDAFGPVIKEGLWEDFERREKLLGLSRFTTTSGEKRSLKQYVENLKPNQTEIYYLTGDSIERLKSNPKLESATARGIEVLLLTDPVDAFWTSAPLDFGGKPLKSLSQGDIDFGLIPLLEEKTDDKKDESATDEAATIAVIKDALGDRVSDVRASQRLTSSASCLVAGGDGRDRQLERLLAMQNKGPLTKPILEINMRHPLVATIAGAQDEARDLSFLLLEQAQILDGELPEDPAGFADQAQPAGAARRQTVAGANPNTGQAVSVTSFRKRGRLHRNDHARRHRHFLRQHSGLSRLRPPDGPGAVFAVAGRLDRSASPTSWNRPRRSPTSATRRSIWRVRRSSPPSPMRWRDASFRSCSAATARALRWRPAISKPRAQRWRRPRPGSGKISICRCGWRWCRSRPCAHRASTFASPASGRRPICPMRCFPAAGSAGRKPR